MSQPLTMMVFSASTKLKTNISQRLPDSSELFAKLTQGQYSGPGLSRADARRRVCPFLLEPASRPLATSAGAGRSRRGFPSQSALGGCPRSSGRFTVAGLLGSSFRGFLRSTPRAYVSSSVGGVGDLTSPLFWHMRASSRSRLRHDIGGSSCGVSLDLASPCLRESLPPPPSWPHVILPSLPG
jgi:hypothetical protein